MRSIDDMRICSSSALTGLLRNSSAPAENDGNEGGGALEHLRQLVTVDVGHHHVEQNEIGLRLFVQAKRVGQLLRREGFGLPLAHHLGEVRALQRVVVDDEYPCIAQRIR
jgi:hypothetical protein